MCRIDFFDFLKRIYGMFSSEVQKISAGGNFDGTIPTTHITKDGDAIIYTPCATGGLFKLIGYVGDDTKVKYERRKVQTISIKLGGQSAWNIYLTDGAVDILFLTGTTETDVTVTGADCPVLSPFENLKIVTVGASTAMEARITYDVVNVKDQDDQ